MTKQSTETNKELLNAIIKLSEEAKKAEFLLEAMVIPIEEFLYGNVLQNILNNLLDENNKDDLYNEFGISNEEISKIRSYPSLVEFVTDENPKGTAEDYLKLKETLATRSFSAFSTITGYVWDTRIFRSLFSKPHRANRA